MSKVNFVSEFNAFMRFARDNSLSLRERMLWIALFYIANDRAVFNEQTQEYEWPDGFIQVSNGELNLYCCLDKRSIEALRNGLKQRGLIDFQSGQKNKKSPGYRLIYLSANVRNNNVPNIAPNNTPNNAPNHAPNNTPNHAPNHVPNCAPNYAENAGVLGTNLHPTMPPLYINKNIDIKHIKAESGNNANETQRTYRSDRNGVVLSGFVDLDDEAMGAMGCSGFVPLSPKEGCM